MKQIKHNGKILTYGLSIIAGLAFIGGSIYLANNASAAPASTDPLSGKALLAHCKDKFTKILYASPFEATNLNKREDEISLSCANAAGLITQSQCSQQGADSVKACMAGVDILGKLPEDIKKGLITKLTVNGTDSQKYFAIASEFFTDLLTQSLNPENLLSMTTEEITSIIKALEVGGCQEAISKELIDIVGTQIGDCDNLKTCGGIIK